MPTRLLNQPDDGQLSVHLKSLLTNPEWQEFYALVAFAVSSGVVQLQTELESLLARGGRVRIVVGVSNRVTSVEALELLLQLTHKGAEVFVFHNDNSANPIFHPKLYVCRSKDKGLLVVGSNNLTGKGLSGNYEISLHHDLDFSQQADVELIKSVEKIFQSYCNVEGQFSHALNANFLRRLEEEGYLGSELRGTNRPETSGESEVAAATLPRKKLFASRPVPRPPVPKPVAGRTIVRARPSAALGEVASDESKGPLVWEKKLAKSDAQSQKGHPTGVVRLTQAKWKVNGELINQVTYFRRNLFGDLPWKTVKERPLVDATEVQFNITILGSRIAVRRLKISDKPSGEAGQGNYTSSLHWGDLGEDIRKAKLAGKILRLYAPPPGSVEPFFIDVS
ncbi:MAG: phospholipase D-like domain-containing protein [Terriglobales bacterium]